MVIVIDLSTGEETREENCEAEVEPVPVTLLPIFPELGLQVVEDSHYNEEISD